MRVTKAHLWWFGRVDSRHLVAIHAGLLLAASATVRLLFLALLPAQTYSADVQNWRNVDSALQAGDNPYNVTTHLNWPPVWMQFVFVMGKIARAWHIDLGTVIRVVLIGFESGLLVCCYLLLRKLADPKRAFVLALYGIALNPIAVLLVCQHCNFDVIVGLFALLGLANALRFSESGDEREWLYACACFGVAVLSKTVPFVLIPLLGFGLREITWRSRVLGAVLLLGPVTLGMSIIYPLGPQQVTANVLAYRSLAGWFGFTGLFELAKWHGLTELYTAFFTKTLLAVIAVGATVAFRRGRANAEELVLLGLGLLAMVPCVGPGYGPQYFFWFLALVPVALAVTGNHAVRKALLVFMGVAIVTYTIEYAMFSSHGQFLVRLYPGPKMHQASSIMSSRPGQTLIRLPLFITWMIMLGSVFGHAARSMFGRPELDARTSWPESGSRAAALHATQTTAATPAQSFPD
jgi:hypothetical protein